MCFISFKSLSFFCLYYSWRIARNILTIRIVKSSCESTMLVKCVGFFFVFRVGMSDWILIPSPHSQKHSPQYLYLWNPECRSTPQSFQLSSRLLRTAWLTAVEDFVWSTSRVTGDLWSQVVSGRLPTEHETTSLILSAADIIRSTLHMKSDGSSGELYKHTVMRKHWYVDIRHEFKPVTPFK